jgi:hypothetical protein
MRHISLPGLSLAACVIVAAVFALLALSGAGGMGPGAPLPPPAGGAAVRLTPGEDASEAQYVAGEGSGAVLGGSAQGSATRR